MLTWSVTLDYVMRNLGFPLMNIEVSQEDIQEYIKQYTLRDFSRYRPYVRYLTVKIDDTTKINNYTIRLPLDEEHPLISIAKVIQTNKYFIMNFPLDPIPVWRELPSFVDAIQQSNAMFRYSWYNITFEFIPPDELKLFPAAFIMQDDYIIIRGLFVHSIDTIPEGYTRLFLDLALADVMDYIANLRLKYQSFSTPYGEVQLNASDLKSQASDLRSRVMEELKSSIPTPFIMVG